MIFLLGCLIAKLRIGFHQLILHLEIEVVLGITVALDGNQMFLTQAMYKADGFLLQVFQLHRLVVHQQRISSRKMNRHQTVLIHHRFLLFLLLRFRRRQLAQQSLIHIHGCGYKEEYQQHKRDVGC